MNKMKWKCQECKVKKNQGLTFTPPSATLPIIDVASASIPSPAIDTGEPSSMVNLDTRAFMAFIEKKFSQQREDWKKDLKDGLKPVQNDLAQLSDRLDKWENRVKVIEDKVHALETSQASLLSQKTETKEFQDGLIEENCKLRQELDTVRSNWEDMEQRSRLFNIEIQNIPEKKGENLLSIFEAICTKIQTPITRDNVRAVHRVRHNTATDKPKNIIVQLNSRWQRDDVLAAAHVRRGLTTDQLGVDRDGQKPCTVYINEHLTLSNKIVYSKARQFAKDHSYKHVWVKNGTVLLRKTDSSKAHPIRHIGDLDVLNNM